MYRTLLEELKDQTKKPVKNTLLDPNREKRSLRETRTKTITVRSSGRFTVRGSSGWGMEEEELLQG